MLKVTLISPPQVSRHPQPPMGLALIASVLERRGYDVDLIDASVSEVPSKIDADVVGLTAVTPNINKATAIARTLKVFNPNLTIILGGVHATLLPEETLIENPEVDIIVRGEGEQTIVELLDVLEKKQPLTNVNGINYRAGECMRHNYDRPINTDLDNLPFPSYHLLPEYKPAPPRGKALPFTTMITSRGCPYKCSYCCKAVFGSKFRGQSPMRVVDEIVYHKGFGVKEIAFFDDVFTLNRARAYNIADDIIRRGLTMAWSCVTRVDLVDKGLLLRMKQAGCYNIAYGIECASQEALDNTGKGMTIQQIESAIRMTQDLGIQTIGYFLIGFPNENVTETIEFAKRLELDYAQFSTVVPFPGTALYKENNASWDDYDNERDNYVVLDGINKMELRKQKGKAYRDFYLRPAYLWQRIKRMRSIEDIIINIKGFLMLFGRAK